MLRSLRNLSPTLTRNLLEQPLLLHLTTHFCILSIFYQRKRFIFPLHPSSKLPNALRIGMSHLYKILMKICFYQLYFAFSYLLQLNLRVWLLTDRIGGWGRVRLKQTQILFFMELCSRRRLHFPMISIWSEKTRVWDAQIVRRESKCGFLFQALKTKRSGFASQRITLKTIYCTKLRLCDVEVPKY